MGTYSLKGGDEEVNAKSTVSFSWEVTEVRRKSQLDGEGEERRLILKNISCADLKDRDDGEGYDGDVSDPLSASGAATATSTRRTSSTI